MSDRESPVATHPLIQVAPSDDGYVSSVSSLVYVNHKLFLKISLNKNMWGFEYWLYHRDLLLMQEVEPHFFDKK